MGRERERERESGRERVGRERADGVSGAKESRVSGAREGGE